MNSNNDSEKTCSFLLEGGEKCFILFTFGFATAVSSHIMIKDAIIRYLGGKGGLQRVLCKVTQDNFKLVLCIHLYFKPSNPQY